MPSYLHPGVYVEEIPSGSKPIEGVGTSTAAFVGYATKGPIGEPTLISKWDEYEAVYGGVRDLGKATEGDPMGLSVAAFFQNGGTKAYIVRLAANAKKAEGYVDHPNYIGKQALKFTAINEGIWANGVVVKISDNPLDVGTLYDVQIGRESEDASGNVTFSPIESFKGVSLDSNDPLFIKNVIDGVSRSVTVDFEADVSAKTMISDQYLGTSTSGDLAGVSLDFSGLAAANRKLRMTIDGTEKTITLDGDNFTDLSALAAHIRNKARESADPVFANFSCEAKGNRLVLTSGTRQSNSSVKVTHDFGIAARLKLGVALYQGSSTSGNLGSSFTLSLTGIANSASRSLKGKIDGVPFGPFDFGQNDFALADIAAKISEIPGVTCNVIAAENKLELVSNTHNSTSSVEIQSDYGVAPTLKLGVHPIIRGEEITGQEFHEKSVSIGTSTSGDLGLPFSLALSDSAIFPNAESRSLRGKIDGNAFGPFDFGATDLLTIAAVASKIDGIGGLSCTVNGDKLVLASDTQGANSSIEIQSDYGIAPKLKLGIKPTNLGGAELTGAQNRDLNCRTELTGQETADSALPKDRLDGGTDGSMPGEIDYENVFAKFIKYRDINIVCLPGKRWSTNSSGDPVIQKAIAHAEKMKNRMVIIDPPPSYLLGNEKTVKDMGLPSQTYCVTYYPWIKAANRFYHPERAPGLPKNVLVPPSGYAAGMWAKIDGKRGVWKAPAGMETGLLGVSGIEFPVEDDEQDSLNPWGINCLRRMPGAGPVIWGTRTLATKADPEWRYVPVRRTAIMIEQSIYEGIQWAVFEPNDHRLWSSLRANIGNFMNGLFRAGAFQGEKSSDAYFVRCGLGDTMTQGEIDAGQVIVIVGFAPLKPAEFVIVRIQQKVNQQ